MSYCLAQALAVILQTNFMVMEVFMLALLFAVVIGLLGIVVRLLQRYFALYIDLDHKDKDRPDELLHQLEKQAVSNTHKQKVEEVNALINERVAEFDKKFPPLDAQMDGPEALTIAFKKLIRSSLTMLKERR